MADENDLTPPLAAVETMRQEVIEIIRQLPAHDVETLCRYFEYLNGKSTRPER